MSGVRRVASSTAGSILRAAACASALSRMVCRLPSICRKGGTEAWRHAGLPLETGATHMASEADDVVLSARERNQNREEAMREYLAWEINLVNEMATDDDHRFRVVA